MIYKKRGLILIFCLFFLILIPFFWNKGLSLVGGDDGKLYYLFPFDQISSYSDKIISDNGAGGLGSYFPIQFAIPFLSIIGFLKKVFFFLDTQNFLLGLNLSLGFLFFYLLAGLFLKEDDWETFFIRIFSGLFYVFSNFSFYTVWKFQFFSVYLVSFFPMALYFFAKSIIKKNYFYLILASLVTFIFSVFLWTMPWLMAMLICSLPFFVYLFTNNPKIFIKFLIFFFFLAFLLNSYWLVYFLHAPLSSDKNSSDILSNTISTEFREDNRQVIRDVSKNNQIIYPLLNLFHKKLASSSQWAIPDVYRNWDIKFLPFNLVFLLMILLGAFYALKKIRLTKIYSATLASWIIALFLFTVHIGSWGAKLFLWFNEKIPGFSMFRNMHDKFGLALSFTYAFLLAISLKIVFSNLKENRIKKIILIVSFLILILSAKPFIFGEYFNKPIWTTKTTFETIHDFNSDFYDLLNYLKSNHEASRYLWLPMNRAGYALIQDSKLDNHYYSGISPLNFLSGTSDFTGLLSFGKFYSQVSKLILDKNYEGLSNFMREMNVKYIIVNNNISQDLQKSYLYKSKFYNAQQNDLFKVILGEKIRDFGSRYSLYKINEQFFNEKLYATDNISNFPENFSQVSYKKIASYKYEIKINNLNGQKKLVFLDPYQKLWELDFRLDNKNFINGSHELVFGYANGWTIDTNYIKQNFSNKYYKENPDGSINLDLVLHFLPEKYFHWGVFVSGATLLFCLSYLVYNLKWRKNKGHINKDDQN